jgi:hypothetical protein
MIIERSGKKYVKVGYLEVLESDVNGKTHDELKRMLPAANAKVVEELSRLVSPKTKKKKKPSSDQDS